MQLLLLGLVVSLTVFYLVPRGVSAGDVVLRSDRMEWNVSTGCGQAALDLCMRL